MDKKVKKQTLPKILSISLSTWRNDSGIHTQTDLFKYWEADRVAQIYTRSDLPDTSVCNSFFRISENNIIKSVYNRKPVGERVGNHSLASLEEQKAINKEKELYSKKTKKRSWIKVFLREIVWFLGKWKTKELLNFINDENPDIYFIPIYPVLFMGRLQNYILKKNPKPYICYFWDDNYSYKACGKNIFSYIHRFFLRKYVKELVQGATEVFAITKMQAEEIAKTFEKDSIILTKGIDYNNLSFEKKEISFPIKMVYTGKLIIGRESSLIEISKAMKKINHNKVMITLDIYSPDVVNSKTMQYLNSNGCHFCGGVTNEKIGLIQKNADIVVFVESLEKEHCLAARLSFSTKLTDYFKSGKCIFAVGDERIAPIKYLTEEDAAVVVTKYEDIEKKLRGLIDNPKKIYEYARKSFDCGKRNHNENAIKQKFVNAFINAANGD